MPQDMGLCMHGGTKNYLGTVAQSNLGEQRYVRSEAHHTDHNAYCGYLHRNRGTI